MEFKAQNAVRAVALVSLSARHCQAGPPDRWSFGRVFTMKKSAKMD